MHWKGDAERTVITENQKSLIQAKQAKLVMAQQIRMHNILKTTIKPSPFMKNSECFPELQLAKRILEKQALD